MLQRNAELYLHAWYRKERRKPLMLRGACQVGKSTLVRKFAQDHRLILNEINLEQHLYLDTIFGSLDMDDIIRELDALMGRNINTPGSVLFMDVAYRISFPDWIGLQALDGQALVNEGRLPENSIFLRVAEIRSLILYRSNIDIGKCLWYVLCNFEQAAE